MTPENLDQPPATRQGKPVDCIYCGAATGSAEHVVLAALGGLRKDRGILCDDCNQRFGRTVDRALAEDMAPINAIIGVFNGRTREPIATTFEVGTTGLKYVISEGHRISHPRAVEFSASTENGCRTAHVVASTRKQADDFIANLRKSGNPFTVVARENVPLFFPNAPSVAWNFGGNDTFRAVARIVVNLFATRYPSLVRQPWCTPLKEFIQNGGDSDQWVTYEYRDDEVCALPKDSFDFQHRFIISLDAANQVVCARVSLLRLVELSVRLGRVALPNSETFIYDMDVLARRAPGDIAVQTFDGQSLAWIGEATKNPAPQVQQRLADLSARRDRKLWNDDAPALVAAVNAAQRAPLDSRHDMLVAALRGQQQRLLNLAVSVVRDFEEHLAPYGEEGARIAKALGALVEPDPKSRTGVTELTRATAEMLCVIVADHLLDILKHDVDGEGLRPILEGRPGKLVIARHMLDQFRATHPLFAKRGEDEPPAGEGEAPS